MARRANAALIGAFVIGALALLIVGALALGAGRWLSSDLRFVLSFREPVTGLIVGSPVEFRGVKVGEVLGLFRFDLYGKTAFLYCLATLFVGWWVVRRIIYSPYGAMLTGIRENATRMHAIGAPVYWGLVLIYTISATMAGIAGALLTQVNQFVGLNVLGLEPSGDVLVMLILGGVGRLYGAFVGPVVYIVVQDTLAKQYPEYWYLGIGALLIVVVLFARGGILGILDVFARNKKAL